MNVIPAVAVEKYMMYSLEDRIENFNRMVDNQKLYHQKFELKLPFHAFGSRCSDVQFVEDAGYHLAVSGDRTYWSVTIPLKCFDEDYSSSTNTSLLASEVVKRMPSIHTLRVRLFNNYVDQQLNKNDPTPFELRLNWGDFGDKIEDLSFIKDLGYCIEGSTSDQLWDITLPDNNSTEHKG